MNRYWFFSSSDIGLVSDTINCVNNYRYENIKLANSIMGATSGNRPIFVVTSSAIFLVKKNISYDSIIYSVFKVNRINNIFDVVEF